MATYSLSAAQQELDDLIDRSERGQIVEILAPSGGRARLVAMTIEEQARLGDDTVE